MERERTWPLYWTVLNGCGPKNVNCIGGAQNGSTDAVPCLNLTGQLHISSVAVVNISASTRVLLLCNRAHLDSSSLTFFLFCLKQIFLSSSEYDLWYCRPPWSWRVLVLNCLVINCLDIVYPVWGKEKRNITALWLPNWGWPRLSGLFSPSESLHLACRFSLFCLFWKPISLEEELAELHLL